MPSKWFSGIATAFSLVGMALPCGTALELFQGPGPALPKYYAYWSTMPLNAGNFFPLVALAATTAALVALLSRRNCHGLVSLLFAISIGAQAVSWLLFPSITLTSLAIVLLQSAVLLQDHLPQWHPFRTLALMGSHQP